MGSDSASPASIHSGSVSPASASSNSINSKSVSLDINATLTRFQMFGIKLGLDSSYKLLARLGNPHQRVPIVHVAGSNGKGSVCAYLSSVLTAAGYRVGRYTSPHLIDWTERICINDQPIAPVALQSVLQQVIAVIDFDHPSTQFEVITAAAWLYFAQQEVDIAVIEVGLGGRLDSTNVVDRPLASVITSISREHWQQLGPTIADIAAEKAGILKPGCPAVVGSLPPEAMAVVRQRITELGCPAVYPKAAIAVNPASSPAATIEGTAMLRWASTDGISYPLPLLGDIQLQNSALAIATVQLLRQQGWVISEAAIATGMANTRWPGRLEWVTWHDRQILIDGAHNPDSARVLRQFVDSLSRSAPIYWVLGMMSTKDHADSLRELLRPGERLYLVPVPDPSTAEPERLAAIANEVCSQLAHCQPYSNSELGLQAALTEAGDAPDALIVLTGSLYLIGHFLAVARSTPPTSNTTSDAQI